MEKNILQEELKAFKQKLTDIEKRLQELKKGSVTK